MNNSLDFFRITGVVLGLLILVSCSNRNQEEGSWSHFMGLVDTVTVRDTILKVDTLIVDREVILRDTVKVEKKIVLRDTVLIEKEVLKKVEVPADIPEEYKRAFEKFKAENFATTATDATIFSGMDKLRVIVFLNEDAKEMLSEQRVRDKFELVLRGYGIPVLSLDHIPFWASGVIYFDMQAIYREDHKMGAYTIELSVFENVIFYRDGKPYEKRVILWDGGGSFGYAGRDKIKDALLSDIEQHAERVANLYLSVNPR